MIMKVLDDYLKSDGKAGLDLPPVIFGTSGLGNLFIALTEVEKLNIIKECVRLLL